MNHFSFYGLADPISSLLHLLGALSCVVAFVPLWRLTQGDIGRRISVGIFCTSAFLLLLISGLYHLLPYESGARNVLLYIDHAAIFVLIAGTFTPIHALLFRGARRWAPLLLIWSIAITGIILKSVYFSRISAELGLSIYLLMGWLGAISCGMVWQRFGMELVAPLLQGSASYTLGTAFELFHSPTIIPGVFGSHELFHFAVLLGVAFHWRLVSKIATHSAVKPAIAHVLK